MERRREVKAVTQESELGRLIWETSQRDEGSISATGANIVADAILAAGYRKGNGRSGGAVDNRMRETLRALLNRFVFSVQAHDKLHRDRHDCEGVMKCPLSWQDEHILRGIREQLTSIARRDMAPIWIVLEGTDD